MDLLFAEWLSLNNSLTTQVVSSMIQLVTPILITISLSLDGVYQTTEHLTGLVETHGDHTGVKRDFSKLLEEPIT